MSKKNVLTYHTLHSTTVSAPSSYIRSFKLQTERENNMNAGLNEIDIKFTKEDLLENLNSKNLFNSRFEDGVKESESISLYSW